MKTFKVIALSVGGLGNKIFHSGDIVNSTNFPDGNAEKLVEQGFLKPIDDEDKASEDCMEINENSSAKDLKDALAKKGIEFKTNASKSDLFALWGKTLEDEAKKIADNNQSSEAGNETSDVETEK